MLITISELKNNLTKYIKISQSEDVFITQNGNIVSKLSNPCKENIEKLETIFGTLPKCASLEEVSEGRIVKLLQ